jgi:hypothetical protein
MTGFLLTETDVTLQEQKIRFRWFLVVKTPAGKEKDGAIFGSTAVRRDILWLGVPVRAQACLCYLGGS